MLLSLALVLMLGIIAAQLCERLRLPGLLGMLLVGMALGPHALGLLDEKLMAIAPDLRQLALVVILTRVGLSLQLTELRRVGRPAFLMCWLPALFEIAGIVWLAPLLLGVSILEAAILGAVVAAVSPAVIVPRMLSLMDRGYGGRKSIPQLLVAGASVDDIFVIVLFSSFVAMATGAGVTLASFVRIPLAVVAGIAGGIVLGLALAALFRRLELRDSLKVLILLSIAFFCMAFEQRAVAPFSALLAIICMGLTLLRREPAVARRLAVKFSKVWVAAEILLFVLVGAAVDIRYALAAGLLIVLLVVLALVFHMAGVWCSLLGTPLAAPERFFCMVSYIPKATVQAAIGAVSLGMGLSCGPLVLAVAVVAILLTAPLGALAVDLSYRACLAQDHVPKE